MPYDVQASVAAQHLTGNRRAYWAGVGMLLALLFVALPVGLVSVQSPDPGSGRSLDGEPASGPTP